MDAAVWGVIGTLIGGMLTMVGNWTLGRAQARTTTLAEERKNLDGRRQEQRIAYLRLLLTCRQIRTMSRDGHLRAQDETDRVQHELSSSTYEISLIAPDDVVQVSEQLAISVRDYFRMARSMSATPPSGDVVQLDALRARSRHEVDHFIAVSKLALSGQS